MSSELHILECSAEVNHLYFYKFLIDENVFKNIGKCHMDMWKCSQTYDSLCIVMFVILVPLQNIAIDKLVLAIIKIINLYTLIMAFLNTSFRYCSFLFDYVIIIQ